MSQVRVFMVSSPIELEVYKFKVLLTLTNVYITQYTLNGYLLDKPYERTCDFCGRKYTMNNRTIPRLYLVKRIDISDIESKDLVASPDYCDICIMYIERILERKRKLLYRVNSFAKHLTQLRV